MSTDTPFITEDFLLRSDPARKLYHDYARDEPIFDYHCHLSPEEIASNRRFENLYEVWLAGDHYKWRAMRANGIPEELCTGDGSPKEKFMAWAKTVPNTLRNPLYQWSHLELKRYFGINLLINESTAEEIWQKANARLADPDFCVHGILNRFKVRVICTTDDPTSTLEDHQEIRKSDLKTRVYPAFRPDRAFRVDDPEDFNPWCDQLAEISRIDTGSFSGFLDALSQRHDFFHSLGARLSDHGLSRCPEGPCSEGQAKSIYEGARGGQAATPEEKERFSFAMMVFFGRLDAEKGWTKQMHLGALRATNTRLYKRAGNDIGTDSIADVPQAVALSRYFDQLDSEGSLPKFILYNLNPADNYLFASMIGNFQDGSSVGKIQFGSGWWFLDQKEAMEWQLNALSNNGLLAHFVGMLTDSRSFLSYCRHEYFRRVLCNLIGTDMLNGELPDDYDLVGGMVRRICYSNAADYFGMEPGRA
ncbi:MAG: glucuronate isomerase [Verrucomicrobia bacterium]|nr:MAG: glucuronate isomerase [Verrucomicrobiota bacterium]